MNTPLGKKRRRPSKSLSVTKAYQNKGNNIFSNEKSEKIIEIGTLNSVPKKYFIANGSINSSEKETNVNFLKRKQQAIEIINNLKNKSIKNVEDVKNAINESLSLNNTNKALIYESLKIMKNLNMTKECDKYLNDVKFSITRKFEIIDNNNKIQVDLSKIVSLKNIYIFEDDKAILKEYINSMNFLDKVYYNIKSLKNKNKVKDKDIKNLLTFKVKKQKNNKYNIENKISTDNDIKDLYNNILGFLNLFLIIKEYAYFSPNQPVDYKDNQTLFYISCFYKLYDNIVIVSNKNNNILITLNEMKIKIFSLIKDYRMDFIKEIKNNGGNVNESSEKKIHFVYFCFKTKFVDNLGNIIKRIMKRQSPLTEEDINTYIFNNKDNDKSLYIKNNNLICEYNKEIYKYEYKNFNSNLLDCFNIKDSDFLKTIKYNNACITNFFDENDLIFMKYLLKKILKSKLFKELWEKYSKVNKDIEYYFSDDENIEDFFKKIYFYPFAEHDFGIQALTYYNDLKIIISGLPISNIDSPEVYSNCKLLEMARKIIIILHEVCHFIKRALNLITNGKVSCVTIEKEDEDPDIIEAGRFFEQIVFGWTNSNDVNDTINKRKSLDNIHNKNKENVKVLNIKKSLKLLNAITYNNTINGFQKKFYDNKDFKIEDLDDTLLEYLKKINFDINKFYENSEIYEPFTIDCTRKSSSSFSIVYKSDSHNFKH